MTWWLSAIVLFGVLTALFLAGLAAAFAFFGINIVGAWVYLGKEAGLIQLIRNGIASITSFSLTPIPFFIMMGEVLFHTGVAMKAIDAIDRLIWRVPGRLSVVAVVAGTIFSAISGSTIATTALLGSLLLPQMLARGYHPNMAMGPIMAIGGVDMLIPPSALTVLLGSLAGISISQLLIAGIVPGVLLSCLFVGWIVRVTGYWYTTGVGSSSELSPTCHSLSTSTAIVTQSLIGWSNPAVASSASFLPPRNAYPRLTCGAKSPKRADARNWRLPPM